MKYEVDLAIVGAGAAGLATAIFAAERMKFRRVALLDGAKTLGAKILVSGGGRCNVTHQHVTARDFFGNRRVIRNILAAFSADDTVKWFGSLGVELKREETGKLFPVTDRARTVLAALMERCRILGVQIYLDHRVTAIAQISDADRPFMISHRQGEMKAGQVVLATGGRSLPKSGSDGLGYELARSFGHRVTDTVPALVALTLEDTSFHRSLAGVSHQVQLTTMVDGIPVDRRTGSLLWTHQGISGPAVMDTSRFWTLARTVQARVELFGNFLPDQQPDQAAAWLKDEAVRFPQRSTRRVLSQRLPERVAEAMCGQAKCSRDTPIRQLSRGDRDRLCQTLTRFAFPVTGDRGWNHAEVTAGGVPLEEINSRTMESTRISNLYMVGEMLDCDGRIGGFNFQWAWATGYLAGRAISAKLIGDPTDRSASSLESLS
ncbi:putative Oxidoreductase with FAD/NAD(P)-binding domain [Nitrospira sp. KM1]|uniref:NAD(P)/FAD-dependent oxidoreductase n=1 Tax=Nitrospira sp. KM1 TaxID=1936990 RepID=UPI0013A72244|nr:NAD(P)/FAD-dependent oxidoreductase [Nitrospira sp. KM1]BCA55170.1 putative Oxidoreductase with FAD/NAD(P)-binding domain [Nitrospira sp. KM1]